MISANNRATRLDYCQYLLSSQINYTLTNFADHSQQYSHDQLNRYLGGDKLTPRLLWEQVKTSIVTSPDGYLLFDDTVADKNYSFAIELVRRQYSGNVHGIIKGIGIVTCAYVNPETFDDLDDEIIGEFLSAMDGVSNFCTGSKNGVGMVNKFLDRRELYNCSPTIEPLIFSNHL
jgi:hypothetical protein